MSTSQEKKNDDFINNVKYNILDDEYPQDQDCLPAPGVRKKNVYFQIFF